MEISLRLRDEQETISFGFLLSSLLEKSSVVALSGDLGAGKTTFTKGVGKYFKVDKVINSPTFTIMKIYDLPANEKGISRLFHLDVYRINDDSDFDLEEYFYMDGISIIEWAENIESLLPDNAIRIAFFYEGLERIAKVKMDNERIELLRKMLKENNYEIIN